MKKAWTILLCLIACGLGAKELAISEQGKAEAALYVDFVQAEMALQAQDPQACSHYEKLLPRAPESRFIRRQLLLCYLQANEIESAQKYADFLDPENATSEDLAVYALYQLRVGNLSQAQDYYEQALDKSPEDSRILYQYVTLISVLDVDRAAAKLQERKTAYPETSAALDYYTGNLYWQRKQPVKALEYYNSATKTNPQYVEPYLARAEIYEKTGNFFLMLHELEEVEKMGYESAAVFSHMGSVYVIVKDHPRAKEYFQKAKKADSGDDAAGYFLALYAEQDKDFAAAAQYLRETNGFAQDAGKWIQVSFYQQQMGDSKAALKTLEQAYKKFENNVEVGYFYALLLQDQKQPRKAARVLEGVLKTNPKYENARLAYAYALDALGKYSQMEEQLRTLLDQNPKNAAAYNLLGFSLADRNIRLDEAQELLSKALSLSPSDRAFMDSMAWVYYRQGKYQQALDLLKQIDESFIAQNTEVAYHLGSVYYALGNTEQARAYLTQAADIKEAAKLLKRLPPAAK